MTHICVGKLTIIGSDNGLSPGQRHAIISTNAGILLIGPLGTNFSEILIAIHTFSFKKMHLEILSGKWQPFCLGLNVLRGDQCTGWQIVDKVHYPEFSHMNLWCCISCEKCTLSVLYHFLWVGWGVGWQWWWGGLVQAVFSNIHQIPISKLKISLTEFKFSENFSLLTPKY